MSKQHNSASILIVDDVANNLRLLEDILTPLNYRLLFATNGRSAIEIAKQKKPDLILLDILMPDLNGYEVCKQLKNSLLTRHIPVIFVSAVNSSEDKAYALEVGGVDFITKPFDPLEIKARIKSNLSRVEILNRADYLLKQTYHELNTPLCIIDTAISLQKRVSGESKYLDNISAASKTLHNMYKDLYFFIQEKEQNRGEGDEKCELYSTLLDRINYFEIIAKTNKLSIELKGEKNSSTIAISNAELERVLDNLISNAIRHSQKETIIYITVFTGDERLLSIQNSVAPQDNTTSYHPSIPGIGFDIVNNICKANNINISFSIESDMANTILSQGGM